MKEKIILLGGGGHCKSVIDVIEQEGRFQIAGIVEKFVGESKPVLGYPLIGTDDELEELRKKYKYAIVSVGHIKSNSVRVKLFEKLEAFSFSIPTIISPFAYVSPHATIEKGTVVMHHAVMNAGVKVGKNCIINSKALLEHDTQVGDYCHISTGALLNGDVTVKANSFVGSGAIAVQGSVVNGFVKARSIVK
ncbi:NeuD/PglB/VioB family sugar acetyltransferase [Sulfurimonas sp.]|uniref:NeuD/PglB/VioB family sugar acetyltransferase n=1 Tax=Sulfurimonas sp. TaxID=2022749 RepID=UPI00260EDFEF|nr:NeuD/PglB/VioB family sugar acetyltransferase [Sulfurimonas sp.]